MLTVTEKNKYLLFYGISFVFVLLNVFFLSREIYLFSLLPLICILLVALIYRIDNILLLVVFFTPLSISLSAMDIDPGFDLYLPTEPLLIGITILFLLRILHEKTFDTHILRHPITFGIAINIIWIFITSCTSTMPMVSFKFLIARLWFIVGFYFLGVLLFRSISNAFSFVWLYSIAFSIVIFYTLYRLSDYGFFNENAAHFVMTPFYKDHTSYGAMLAMLIPVWIGFLFLKNDYRLIHKIFILFFIILFFVALVFSYTRAAWASMIVGAIAFAFIRLRIKLSVVAVLAVGLLIALYSYRSEIIMKMEKNRQESNADITKHMQSISNISTDASNLERINRWKCAFRMFREKPLFGWGPGTYSFTYGPFQLSYDKTIISTNFGNKGNAHSEYIGPLAESGVLGLLSFLFMVLIVVYYGIRNYYRAQNSQIRILSLSILMGFITYLVHGCINNFLDTDKISVPFWGFIAIITAIDIYHSKEAEKKQLN